ncbi:MAG TPA: hypothetical protein VFD23_06905, partial [Clostridia bacterium]|nr:hypothetical protein [Clostridia bacterium]
MNSEKNNTPADDFDLDKILAEVKALTENETISEEADKQSPDVFSFGKDNPDQAQTLDMENIKNIEDIENMEEYSIYTQTDS